jgi:hypothetical protein
MLVVRSSEIFFVVLPLAELGGNTSGTGVEPKGGTGVEPKGGTGVEPKGGTGGEPKGGISATDSDGDC